MHQCPKQLASGCCVQRDQWPSITGLTSTVELAPGKRKACYVPPLMFFSFFFFISPYLPPPLPFFCVCAVRLLPWYPDRVGDPSR